MNINELEKRVGVAKQNIRFYEKKGLLHPERNASNNYREYTEEDVQTLQVVKILRKLDMPIEDIHKVLSGEIALDMAIQSHLPVLLERQNELEACINICQKLYYAKLETLDTDKVFEQMEEIERKGGKFMSIIDDYRKVEKAESKKEFTFVPDTMVMNPKEFTDALVAYGNEKGLNLVITKESMYPVFEIDGVEYTADRVFGRFGAVIRCTMLHPELAEVSEIKEGRRKILRLLSKYWIFIAVVLFLVVSRVHDGWWGGLVVGVFGLPFLFWNRFLWKSKN